MCYLMFSRSAALAILIVLELGIPGNGWAQDLIRVPDATACEACRVEFRETARIGGDSDPFGVVGRDADRTVFLPSGEFWVASSQVDGTLLRFSPRGDLMEIQRREGEGPGEFQRVLHLLSIEDTLLVVDQSRLTLLDTEGELIRTHPFERHTYKAVASGAGLLVNAFDAQRRQNGIASISSEGATVAHYPTVTRGLDRTQDFRVRIARSANGFWTARENTHELVRWSPAGTKELVLARESAFLVPWELADWASYRPDPYPPRLMDLYEDEMGRVWTISHVADENFVPLDPEDPYGRDEVRPREHPQMDALVEVIDPARGQVVARARFDGVMSKFLTGGRVALFEATPIGAQVIRYGVLRIVE